MNEESDKPRMYFVSDMEGCYRVLRSSKQSKYLCSDEFYDELEGLLENNNKVAFLGDYFEGPEFLFSINNMIKLHKKYPNKVYIILGNRDVNKLRLLFELNQLVSTSKLNESNGWSVWSKFYDSYLKILNSNSNKKEQNLLKIILQLSMGSDGKYVERNDFVKFFLKSYKSNLNIKRITKLNQLNNSNNPNNNLTKQMININNKLKNTSNNSQDNIFEYLFRNGRIVAYDKEFKVLMSHGGGVDAIPSIEFYQDIAEKLNIEQSNISNFNTYFKTIEQARKYLEITGKKNKNINSSSITSIDKLIEAANYPLEQFMLNMSIQNPYYYILQASGLKPDGNKKFVSYIESCDMEKFVKGPRVYNNNNIAPLNLIRLKQLGVDVISYGHINFKLELPLIYSRKLKTVRSNANNRMVFIANDTSSYRPRKNNSNPKIPISYIEKIGNNISNYKIGSEILDGSYNKPNSFLKGPFQYSKVPELETIELKNDNKTENRSKLTVNNKSIKFFGSFTRNHIINQNKSS